MKIPISRRAVGQSLTTGTAGGGQPSDHEEDRVRVWASFWGAPFIVEDWKAGEGGSWLEMLLVQSLLRE